MITANAIMTKSIQTAKKDTPVLEAVDIMLKHSISGLPVVDEGNKVVGIVTEKDVLRFYEKPKDAQRLNVGDIMTKNVICIDAADSLHNVCQCLIKNDFRRVPVVADGKLVGIISRPDVTRGILNKIKRQSVEA